MRNVAVRFVWGCLLLIALASPAHATAPQSAAHAPAPQSSFVSGGLSAGERSALGAGRMISRPLRFDTEAGGRYVGGVSYQVVEAPPEAVLAALSDVTNWPEALPRTKSARLLGSSDGVSRVELVQGNSLVDARYTVLLERAGDATIRFWLDPSQAHDIRDVWGFFRVQAVSEGRSLIAVGVALDLGDGLARMLFEDRIANMALRAPLKIRAFVEPRALALGPFSLR